MAIKCIHHPLQSALVLNEPTAPLTGRVSRLNVDTFTRSNVNYLSVAICISRPVKAQASLFPFSKKKDRAVVKEELLQAIAPLDRGANATPDDQYRVEKIAQDLEATNPTKQPLMSNLLNGKWELLYTTSETILKRQRPKFLRPNGKIYQAINNYTLRAQNLETWPFYNQVTANLTPLSGSRVSVKFDKFKIAGLISIDAPPQAQGELEITYLDDELRVSRGDKGNLFILRMADPTYKVPL
ncbi:hypothetical protein SUGI_0981720 [Cryptomeria japonica]|uniref:probable plastid-lipid-associated protein 4, chloroplastic isoform X1 n=1 Tax=Cryptomeria japonica TaxID=3369 RepID=UPI002414CAA8|nr:probable plastid-lipid-associated protein 4, chloroplastic isoform X1 [Cryptomeria japonica]GLJ46583.1 hypothetical protein SUGI_0981720 [Cryptomeria japonica]